jgi:hypothetical protein
MRDFPRFRNRHNRSSPKNRYSFRNPKHETRNRQNRSAPTKRSDLLAAAGRAVLLGAIRGQSDLAGDLAGCSGFGIVRATRRQLNFFGRASGRSCRTYPLWARLLWQSSIRGALSAPRRNDRGSIRYRVPIDASVDVTEARNARFSRLIKERHPPVDANVYQRGLLPVRSPRGRRSRRSNRCLGRGGLPHETSMTK